jgi:hypothetical protein
MAVAPGEEERVVTAESEVAAEDKENASKVALGA